jgi:hypothetical protein
MLLPLLLNNMMSVAGAVVTPPDIPPDTTPPTVLDTGGFRKAQKIVRKRKEKEIILFIQAYMKWVDF